MNTNDIREHLLSKAPWVDRSKTVDTVKAGDPTREVRTVAVGWIACIENLRAAVELGADLFVTHEPTFWEHGPIEEKFRTVPPGLAKQRLLDESHLVVLRCHDTWDSWPGIGIRDSWASWLGLTQIAAEGEHPWHAAYEIEPTPLRDFARHVAKRAAALGEDSVRVMGDGDRIVCRPAVGVGCGGPDKDMIDRGADVLIVCYDGAGYWNTRQRLGELGAAVLCVEHGTSEIPGMQNLAAYLRQTFGDLTVHHLEHHARPWTVSGEVSATH